MLHVGSGWDWREGTLQVAVCVTKIRVGDTMYLVLEIVATVTVLVLVTFFGVVVYVGLKYVSVRSQQMHVNKAYVEVTAGLTTVLVVVMVSVSVLVFVELTIGVEVTILVTVGVKVKVDGTPTDR